VCAGQLRRRRCATLSSPTFRRVAVSYLCLPRAPRRTGAWGYCAIRSLVWSCPPPSCTPHLPCPSVRLGHGHPAACSAATASELVAGLRSRILRCRDDSTSIVDPCRATPSTPVIASSRTLRTSSSRLTTSITTSRFQSRLAGAWSAAMAAHSGSVV